MQERRDRRKRLVVRAEKGYPRWEGHLKMGKGSPYHIKKNFHQVTYANREKFEWKKKKSGIREKKRPKIV